MKDVMLVGRASCRDLDIGEARLKKMLVDLDSAHRNYMKKLGAYNEAVLSYRTIVYTINFGPTKRNK